MRFHPLSKRPSKGKVSYIPDVPNVPDVPNNKKEILAATIADPNVRRQVTVKIPIHAKRIELWFYNCNRGGRPDWDSRYGQNYWFDVTPA